MASGWVWVSGKPGRTLVYAIERLHDQASYNAANRSWHASVGVSVYSPMIEAGSGRYGAMLDGLESGVEYRFLVVDATTGRQVLDRQIDGRGLKPIVPSSSEGCLVGPFEGHPKPIPAPREIVDGISRLADGIGRLVVHRAGWAWAEPRYRYSGIVAACVLAILMFRPGGPSSADFEEARLFAEQTSIRRVFAQDKELSREVNQQVGFLDQYWDGSTLVGHLAGRMDAIDLAGCPRDFQLAYKRHVAAWGAMSRVKASNEGINGAIKGFFTGGLAVIPAMRELELGMKEVQDSWSQVQQAAIEHGVAP